MNQRKKGFQLTVSFYLSLAFLHLFEEFGITNDTSSIPHFSASLVQARDYSDDGTFRYIGQRRDLLERLRQMSKRCEKSWNNRLLAIPFAHSYTTSVSPNLRLDWNSSAATLCKSCTRPTLSLIAIMASRPSSSFGDMAGSTSVFSWKTKHDSKATTSSGSKLANVFSRISSVRTSSWAELI
jgi:hypothetical protein